MLIGLLFVIILLNAFFAMAEIAIVSARKARLEQAAREGSDGAAAALALAQNPSHAFATAQIGITLIGIVSGALGERTIADDLSAWISSMWPGLKDFAEEASFVIVVALIGYVSVVLGELVPKRLAVLYPESMAVLAARPLGALARVAWPLVKLLSFSADLPLRLFGASAGTVDEVTEEEIRHLVEKGRESGSLEVAQTDLVGRVLDASGMTAQDVMVPRADIEWISENADPAGVRETVARAAHSHFPICRGNLDHLVGVVHIKDLVREWITGMGIAPAAIQPPHTIPDPRAAHPPAPPAAPTTAGGGFLKRVSRKPVFIAETASALQILEIFKTAKTHVGFVLDEHGTLVGLVTLNDLLDRLVGRTKRELDEADPQIVQRPDGSYLLDGMLAADRLRELLETESLPKDDDTAFQTVSGFVMANLGRIPRAADVFAWDRFRVEVMDMDGRRVDKVLLTITSVPGNHDDHTTP